MKSLRLLMPRSPVSLGQVWRTPLYSNAIYLIIGNGVGALFAFAFWTLAARLYPPEEVGLASAAIAAMGILGGLSHFGFGLGLIRFLPSFHKQAISMINFCLTACITASVLLSLVFLLGLDLWSPGLIAFKQEPTRFVTFVIFTAATASASIIDGTFIAERRAVFVTIRGIIFNLLKFLLIIGLVSELHSYGIFGSWGIALTVSILLGLFIFLPRLRRGYLPYPNLRWQGMSEFIRYSLVNYLAVFLWSAPGQILPLMLLERLGAEANAYFYIAWATASALSMISASISTSLFAEGSHEEKGLAANTWRSLSLVFFILVPVAILIIIFADKLLLLFGGAYSENATRLLQILTLALFPLAVNQVYFSILRVQKRLKTLIGLTGFVMLATLTATYLLLPWLGIMGAGVAWFFSQTAAAIWIVSGRGRGKPVLKKLGSILFPEGVSGDRS